MKHSVGKFNLAVRAGAALLAIAALLALAGCGGGNSSAAATSSSTTSSGGASPAITKAQLIKKGDAICRKTDEVQEVEFAAYEKKHPKELTSLPDQEKEVAKAALPPIATEIEELAALGAPRGDEAKVAAIIKGLEKALKATERNPSSVMGLTDGPFIPPDKLAAKYGFKDCAKAL